MKNKIMYAVVAMILGATAFISCNNTKNSKPVDETAIVADGHNSRNSIDYQGTYTGTMPCADCSGIRTEITLNGNSYKMKMTYEGVDESNNTFESSGTFSWDNDGLIITLGDDKSEQYLVGENQLIALNQDGEKITGDLAHMYILKKK